MASKLTRKPSKKTAPSVDKFIAGAEQQAPISSQIISSDMKSYSWEDAKVREDVLKLYNLRLPEPYFFKLKFIAENSPSSMQKFCLDTLLPAIDAKIDELVDGKR